MATNKYLVRNLSHSNTTLQNRAMGLSVVLKANSQRVMKLTEQQSIYVKTACKGFVIIDKYTEPVTPVEPAVEEVAEAEPAAPTEPLVEEEVVEEEVVEEEVVEEEVVEEEVVVLSKDMKAVDAIKEINNKEDEDSIKSFIEGDERVTVQEAANDRIASL